MKALKKLVPIYSGVFLIIYKIVFEKSVYLIEKKLFSLKITFDLFFFRMTNINSKNK